MRNFNLAPLESLAPESVLRDEGDDVGLFFVALALAFNDLKGVGAFEWMIREVYRSPPDGELSAHAGEWRGLKIQLHRMAAGILPEIMKLLQEQARVLNEDEFTSALDAAGSDAQASELAILWRLTEGRAAVSG